MTKAIDLGNFYKIPADNRNLNYNKYIELGCDNIMDVEAYHSHNTQRLDLNGMKNLLLKLDLFK